MIVPIQPGDSGDIYAILQDSLRDTWSLASLQNLLAQPATMGFSYYMDGCAVGLILGQKAGEESEILTFAVLQKHRRRGLGQKLLIHFIEQNRQSGCKSLFLDVAEDNPAALSLYQKMDFVTTGRRPQYYLRPNSRVDAILMRLSL